MAVALTDSDVKFLNTARSILKGIDASWDREKGYNRNEVVVECYAEVAEGAIFAFLNHASTYGKLEAAERRLHEVNDWRPVH